MKATENKSSTTANLQTKQEQAPFFKKEGQDGFFSTSTEQATPFFSPTSPFGGGAGGGLQPKLKVGQPNDKYEKEADSVADTVAQRLAENNSNTGMSPSGGGEGGGKTGKNSINQVVQRKTPDNEEQLQKKEEQEEISLQEESIQRKPIFESNEESTSPLGERGVSIQRKCADCGANLSKAEDEKLQKQEDENIQLKFTEEDLNTDISPSGGGEGGGTPQKEEPLMMKSESAETVGTSTLQSQLDASKGKGSSLPENTRTDMESTIGADFSGVSIHTDNNAVQMNKDLGAKAFTHGSDIYFNQGQYDTNSSGGQHLLAHELTHTVQQGAAIRKKVDASASEPATEEETIIDRKVDSSIGEPAVKEEETLVDRKVDTTVQEPAIQKEEDEDEPGWLQRKIASGLNYLAERIVPGYTLLNVVLGKNIITKQPVARTGVNLIEGFMDLIPIVGKILFNELKETESLNEAGVWVEQKVAEFGIDFNDISRRLSEMWEEMSIWKGIDGNVQIFKKHFGHDIGRILAFKNVVQEKVKELRFEAAFRLVGAHDLIESLKKAPGALKKAIDDPKAVLKSFMGALKNGFTNFKVNFVGHFKNALLGWLFGKAAEMGIQMPKQFNVAGLFGFVAQLLGVTYQQIRAMVVKKLGPKGEKVISYMETAVTFVADLIARGPIALWERVKETLANFKTMLFSKIATLVSTEIIKSAVTKLVSMLNPAGAIVQLVLTVYRVVKFFIEWWERIKDIATRVIGSIAKVALGQFAAASSFIENAFAKGIQIAIGFLASIFGLGGIAAKVKNLIKAIATPVQTAVGKVIDWIVAKGRALFNKVFGKKEKTDLNNDENDPNKTNLKLAVNEVNKVIDKTKDFEQVSKILPQIKAKYGLEKLSLVKNKKYHYHVEAKINPMFEGPEGVLFTDTEINELDKVASKYARQIKEKGDEAIFLKNPREYLAGNPDKGKRARVSIGDTVEALSTPGLKLLANEHGLTVLKTVELKFVKTDGNDIRSRIPELDFLILSNERVVEIISAKMKLKQFSATKDRRLLSHFFNIPLSAPDVINYANTHFGSNKAYSDISKVDVLFIQNDKAERMSLSKFRKKHLSRVVVDEITITPVTPGPESERGIQLRATKHEIIDKTTELIKNHLQ